MIWKLILTFVVAFILGMLTNAFSTKSIIGGTILVSSKDDDFKMRFVLDSEPDEWTKYKMILFKIAKADLPDVSQN